MSDRSLGYMYNSLYP